VQDYPLYAEQIDWLLIYAGRLSSLSNLSEELNELDVSNFGQREKY